MGHTLSCILEHKTGSQRLCSARSGSVRLIAGIFCGLMLNSALATAQGNAATTETGESQDSSRPSTQSDLAGILGDLLVRDETLRSLELEFEAREEAADGSQWNPHVSGSKELCWWARASESSALETWAHYGTDPPRHKRERWVDGEYTSVTDLEAKFPIILRSLEKTGAFSLYTPDFFGLSWGETRLSRLLSGDYGGTVHVIDSEWLRGDLCHRVLYASHPTADGSLGDEVLVFWIDGTRSLLAKRTERLRRIESGGRGSACIRLQGNDYAQVGVWDVLSDYLHESGLWIPVEMRYAMEGQNAPVVIKVDPVSIRVNDVSSPEKIASFPANWYYVVGANKPAAALSPFGPSDSQTYFFYRGLVEDAEWRGLPRPSLADPQVPFSKSSCGPNAAYHVLMSTGRSERIDDLLQSLNPGDASGMETSLSALSRILRERGLATEMVRSDMAAIWNIAANGCLWVIGQVREGASESEPSSTGNHFCVLARPHYAMWAISPPRLIQEWSRDEFEKNWKGHAILVSKSKPELDLVMRTIADQETAGWHTVPWYAAILISSVCMVLVYWTRRRNARASTAA